MSTKIVVALVTITIIIGSLAVYAQIVPDRTKEAVISASAAKRMKLHDELSKKYPNLPDDIYQYLEKTYPHFATRFVKSKIAVLQSMNSRELAELYRNVSKEIDTAYSGQRSKFRKEAFSLLNDKYPDMQKDIKSWRAEKGFKAGAAEQIRQKYPEFRADCMKIIQEKHPAIFMTMMRDTMSTIIEKDPKLPIEIKMEISGIMQEKAPELLAQIAADPGVMNPAKFRAMLRDNPRLAAAVIERLDSKFGDRIRELKRTVISSLIEKDSKEMLSLCSDLLSMIETKYPDLPGEVVKKALQARKEFQSGLRSSHKEFFDEMANLRNESFPWLLKDVTASIDRFSPELRKKMKASTESEFPGFEKKTGEFIGKKYPDLNSTIMQTLK